MASLPAIRDGIKATITAAVPSVQVYDTVADVAVVPAVVVWPFEADFVQAMGRGYDQWEFDLYVLAPRAVTDVGQDALDALVSGAGANSIRQAIWNAKTLGLTETNAHISKMNRYGGQFDVAQIPHVGAVLRLVVHTTGTS